MESNESSLCIDSRKNIIVNFPDSVFITQAKSTTVAKGFPSSKADLPLQGRQSADGKQASQVWFIQRLCWYRHNAHRCTDLPKTFWVFQTDRTKSFVFHAWCHPQKIAPSEGAKCGEDYHISNLERNIENLLHLVRLTGSTIELIALEEHGVEGGTNCKLQS